MIIKMKAQIWALIALCFAIQSCTLDKTDYEAEINIEIPEYTSFSEVASMINGSHSVSIEALNGTFYKGYNEIRIKIKNTETNQYLSNSEVGFLPILTDENNEKSSCPHNYNLIYDSENKYYKGYVVFTEVSTTNLIWDIYINFSDNNQELSVTSTSFVEAQPNKNLNMTSFIGNNDEKYFIALIAPKSPEIAENELVAGIYKYNEPTTPAGSFPDPLQFSYTKVQNHILMLDPRMPEPSMGNHSSPNNQDLIQQADGLYYGIVNYTMTGNWTLNFILYNENNEVIKGTEVSTDFTPGVEGEKSELFIDILFEIK